MALHLYGFQVTSEQADQLDKALDAPAAFDCTRIVTKGGKVLWGHGMLDEPAPGDAEWVHVPEAESPHVHASVVQFIQGLGRANGFEQPAQMFKPAGN